MGDPRHLVLVGLMGSGKSAVGRALAERLGRPYVDNDDLLERRTGRSARDLAARSGLYALHAEEAAAFGAALDRREPSVLGAPASVVENRAVRDRLQEHDVVWLAASDETLADRIESSGDHRPHLGGDLRAELSRQRRERGPRYEQVASMVVRNDDRGVDETVDEIVERLRSA